MSELLIPKKIHYFWFGGAEKSASVLRCIDSWKKSCPDFEIIEWNENNYDIHKHPFMEKAFNDKKWAFVSDYARLDVLVQYGGIYLDTDVEVLKDLSPLCESEAFIGFERDDLIGDGQGFGGVVNYPIFKEMLSEYDGLEEYIESPKLRTKVLLNHGLRLDGSRQKLDGMEIYPVEYFCPKSWSTGKIKITANTFSIHHFDESWKGKGSRKYTVLMRVLNRVFGEKKGQKLFKDIITIKDKLKGEN
ncbi:Glycosyltransferase sugar-binding region containing DXD motif-containing protein [Pseudobutyrivibrio sp. UC1225]|uniref:glycosyltransferase family 32 protein n=1 Tax=Pseudobutyrivibrio sp. UC1225 TaxID=1798185 RepID=UPI0008E02220|nr:glycosyltransferase [Pseudobutyrivibrio sp. UC1225]SFO24701.1 Glycosyltransferase sugar-binding region containing DXD motif-containing protein [Pseudobutyrivibrio sp. UC1225]